MLFDSKMTESVVRQDMTILLLAIAGGGVDAVLILGFNVLTGAQTGNTVLLGTAIALGRLAGALASMISVVIYIIGVIVGELLIVRHRRTCYWPSAVDDVLIAELIMLCCLFVFWHLSGKHPGPKTTSVLIACAASAMGLQSAAMLRLGKVPTTTYITGTLTTFATNLVRWMDLVERTSAFEESRDLMKNGRFSAVDDRPWNYGITWFVYLTGSVLAGILFLRKREMALLLPVFATILAIVLKRHDTDDVIMLETQRRKDLPQARPLPVRPDKAEGS